MKKLRKLPWIFMVFILGSMVTSLLQFQKEEAMSVPANQIEYYFDEDWSMALIDSVTLPETEQKNNSSVNKQLAERLATEEFQEIDLPFLGTSKPGDMVVFKNTLSQEYAGLTLSFSSADATVWAALDGEIIYQFDLTETMSKSPGEGLDHVISIPEEFQEGELWIGITSSYPNAAAALSNVTITLENTVMMGVFGNDIIEIGCCLLIIIMAIILLVLSLIRHFTKQPTQGELFLGLAGLAAGAYCFIGTNTLSLFYDMHESYILQEYLLLLLPLLLSLYFEENLHSIFPRRFSVLIWCSVGNAVVQILINAFNIQDLETMAFITAILLGVVYLAAILSFLQLGRKKFHYPALLPLLSMLALLAGEIITVVGIYIFEDFYSYMSNLYGIAAAGTMMSILHILQLSKEYKKNAEENARLLEEKVKITQEQNKLLALAKKEAEAAKHEALAANEAKGKFLAHMSHEIRTPINAVLGMDEMILRETKEETIKEYAMDIYTAGQTLLSLINDILDFSKIESGKMEIVPVEYDISSLIHDLANMASQRAKAKNLCLQVEIDSEIPCRLYGDDVRIRQVLTNILTNAIKYTKEGTVWLRVQSQRKKNQAVLTFEVEDTGIGIKEEDLPKLFAEFERIEEDKNRNIEGSGLGMNITIQLLSLLGSQLQVESRYGEGSKFYFELKQEIIDPTPIGDFKSRICQIAENYSYSAKFCAPEANILVVDDNLVNRKVFRNLLKETQIQVTEAEGGAECLNLVQENHYDLIFLDHMMPDMDGVETLHRIKKLSHFPCQNTPIIVLTANAVTGAKEQYLSEGFDDFLSKPIIPEKLESIIQQLLPKELLLEGAAMPKEALGQQAKADTPESFLEGLPQVDGLDWRYAWLHLPDQELLAYTLKEFYAQIDSAANSLEQIYGQILEPGQLEQYRIQVHAMKSLAATVGILPLSGVAKVLEYGARDGKIDAVMSITPPFLEEWRSYREKLQGIFGIGGAAKKEATDYSLLQALVEMVRFSIEEMDIDQADQLMGQLQEYEYPEELSQTVQKLATAVTNLDSQEANRLADLLIGQMSFTSQGQSAKAKEEV